MYNRLFAAVLWTGLLHSPALAGEVPVTPFVDGRWQGGVKGGSNSSDYVECWASTEFGDGTVLTLAKRNDGIWNLQLFNPGWRLPQSHRYAMVALVDFYPKLRIAAEARTPMLLEIADIDQISLLGLIENGHTIDLASEGFNEKYELEGSAKIIGRIRSCFDQLLAGFPAAENGAAN